MAYSHTTRQTGVSPNRTREKQRNHATGKRTNQITGISAHWRTDKTPLPEFEQTGKLQNVILAEGENGCNINREC
jgi:hypothetical protein